MQTILVPVEKSSNFVMARNRGHSANPHLDFNFHQVSNRTRSGGFGGRYARESLQLESDLLGGHQVIKEGGMIDTSNRHLVLGIYRELRRLLSATDATPQAMSQAEHSQGSQGN